MSPTSWGSTAVKLLGKTDCPAEPGDLRPIAVHSQVAKVFARILMRRVRNELAPQFPGQTAAKGRQPGDYVWTMQRLCQLALEWGVPFTAVKVDIAKAFDRIRRAKLGTMLFERLATAHPQECRNLLALLLPNELTIATPWADFCTPSNSGVKQGKVESPILFEAAMQENSDSRYPPLSGSQLAWCGHSGGHSGPVLHG